MGKIDFDKKWLLSLSEPARCSVLVHELWHHVIWPKTLRWRKRHGAWVFLGVPILSIAIALGLATAIYVEFRLLVLPGFLGLAFVFWLVLLLALQGRFMRRYYWPVEFECDEAAAKYIGVPATIEVLRSMKFSMTNATHPPTRLRIARVQELTQKYPTPIIDFATLQQETPQAFLPIPKN